MPDGRESMPIRALRWLKAIDARSVPSDDWRPRYCHAPAILRAGSNGPCWYVPTARRPAIVSRYSCSVHRSEGSGGRRYPGNGRGSASPSNSVSAEGMVAHQTQVAALRAADRKAVAQRRRDGVTERRSGASSSRPLRWNCGSSVPWTSACPPGIGSVWTPSRI